MLILHELVVILETLCTKKNGCNFKLRRSFLLILSEHNLGAVFSSLSKVWGQNSMFRFLVIFNAIYYLKLYVAMEIRTLFDRPPKSQHYPLLGLFWQHDCTQNRFSWRFIPKAFVHPTISTLFSKSAVGRRTICLLVNDIDPRSYNHVQGDDMRDSNPTSTVTVEESFILKVRIKVRMYETTVRKKNNK